MNVEAYQADASLFDSKDVIYPFIAHLMKNITSHSLILMIYPTISVSASWQSI